MRSLCNALVRKIARSTHTLPDSLYTFNVKRDGETSFACGGFADIYRGVMTKDLAKHDVALKVFRYFERTPDDKKIFAVGSIVVNMNVSSFR